MKIQEGTFLNKLRLELQSVIFCRFLPAEVIFSSKSLKNSLKKVLPFIFLLSDDNYLVFFAKTLLHVVRLLWATIASFGYASGHRAVGKVPINKSN